MKNTIEVTPEDMITTSQNALIVGIIIGIVFTIACYYAAHTAVLLFAGIIKRRRNESVVKTFITNSNN